MPSSPSSTLPLAGDVTGLDTSTLARLMRDGDVSAAEVMRACLARIALANGEVNAIVTLQDEAALLQAAAEADAQLRCGGQRPLTGIPVVVKDSIATAGMRTTWGSKLLADHVPRADASAVARLRQAGAIVVGKGNTPEFATDLQTDNDLFGPTRNPLDLRLTPGGSSGGVSAAVAAGFAPLGIGTDYGGSIRWPAQCVALVGLRPTCGLVPGTGQFAHSYRDQGLPNALGFQAGLQTIGPMARSVDDLELALTVMAGPDGKDPHAVPVPLLPSRTVELSRLRVGWLPGEGSHPVRADILDVLRGLVQTLEASGLRVEERDPGVLRRAEEVFTRVRAIEGMADVRPLVDGREGQLSPHLRDVLAARPGHVAEYLEAMAERDYLRMQLLEMLEEVPLVLMPVSLTPAFPLGDRELRVDGQHVNYWKIVAPCRAISLFGVPAASVPCGRSRDGMPVSVQIVGRPFRDHEVLAMARRITDLVPHPLGAAGEGARR
ncbi:amidase [Modestobacter lapidis]|nr:amidase [Modestobacter lapidis]